MTPVPFSLDDDEPYAPSIADPFAAGSGGLLGNIFKEGGTFAEVSTADVRLSGEAAPTASAVVLRARGLIAMGRLDLAERSLSGLEPLLAAALRALCSMGPGVNSALYELRDLLEEADAGDAGRAEAFYALSLLYGRTGKAKVARRFLEKLKSAHPEYRLAEVAALDAALDTLGDR